jgi:hypothetical protein
MGNLADSYATLGRHAEALKLLEETLALETKTLGPDHPETLTSRIAFARSLIALDRPSEAVPIIDDSLRRADRNAVDPQWLSFALEQRLRAFAKHNDASGCKQTAEMWERLNRKDAGSLYVAACFRAVTAGVIRHSLPSPDAGIQADAEADAAMRWLTKALEAGYRTPQNLADMARDADLDAVRGRADFRRLLPELFDQGLPKDPSAR